MLCLFKWDSIYFENRINNKRSNLRKRKGYGLPQAIFSYEFQIYAGF